jgi:hypothetical protein
MVVDFIRSQKNKDSLTLAIRQEDQLSYLTQSKIQESSLSVEYLSSWASRQYETNDYILNYVKSIFKTENFLKFFQYYRNPSPSSKLIQNKIKPNLKRVFHSEDGYERYSVEGVENDEFLNDLHVKAFNEMIFDALLFRHNSILVTDLKDTNKPFRSLINLKDVVSIDYDEREDRIEKIAFKAEVNETPGFFYIDDKQYAFVNLDYELVGTPIPHDLGHCPAHFIVKEQFSDDPIVKRFIFSNIREEMEEYVFLKTLQKMTEPNGVFPITVMLDAEVEGKEDKSSPSGEPNTDNAMGSQKAGKSSQVQQGKPGKGILQAGSIITVPQIRKDDGSLDMEAVKNFVSFLYLPVEVLKFIDQRIKDIHNSIISTILGDLVVSTEYAKNKEQIAKSVSVLEDNLRIVSNAISRIRTLSDIDFLGLMYGIKKVKVVNIFCGSDFFLEDEQTLFDLFKTAPNPVERRYTLIRLNQNRYKNNHEQMHRQEILYNLMPFCSDADFLLAKDSIDRATFMLQTRFPYWISAFESEYGDILTFFDNLSEVSNAQKYTVINKLITNLIKSDESYNTQVVQRTEAPVQ